MKIDSNGWKRYSSANTCGKYQFAQVNIQNRSFSLGGLEIESLQVVEKGEVRMDLSKIWH